MMRSSKWALVGLAAMLALPVPALATHMSSYVLNPVEHDDLGRVDEPDGLSTALITSAGNPIRNCVASPNLAAQCTPDAALPPKVNPAIQADVIAPGCSANDGRHVSGECGLYTVGAGHGAVSTTPILAPGAEGGPVTGTSGRTDGKSPGRLTPTTSTTIRFLDARIVNVQVVPPAGGTTYLDINHKLQDRGVSGALSGANPDLGSNFINPGGSALFAWYGTWADKNGNGVVDALGSGSCTDDPTVCGPDGGVKPNNEFKWVGRCIQFDGSPPPAGNNFCAVEGVAMPVWIIPGNHHAICFGFVPTGPCGTHAPYPNSWIDFPLRQVPCFLDTVAGHLTPVVCAGDIDQIDDFDQELGGDPILGPQDSVRRDQVMSDRTGDATDTGRHWVYGNGWATYFYDQGILLTTTMITAATPQLIQDTSLPTYYDTTKFLASDVDRYTSWSPAANDLLQDTVKPAARSQWTLFRDSFIPLQRAEDNLLNSRLGYDQCDVGSSFNGVCAPAGTGPPQGQLDDTMQNAGFAREPNTASDIEPGAVRGVCSAANGGSESTFRGFCNSYAGYRAGYRAWIDMTDAPSIFTNLAWSPPEGNCILCVTGPPTALPSLGVGHPRAPGNHDRALQPGTYTFGGVVGAWKDRVQVHDDEYFLDVAATIATGQPQPKLYPAYTVGPDGWTGDIVNTTATLRARGYGPVSCNINGVVAVREFAQCNPYLDGNIQNPQSYSAREDLGGEFCFAKPGVGGVDGTQWQVVLHPVGGIWTVPVQVWRNFDTWRMGNTAAIEDKTGSTADIVLLGGQGPGLGTRDLVILPQGNTGLPVTLTVQGNVVVDASNRCTAVNEFVRDVDSFVAFSPGLS